MKIHEKIQFNKQQKLDEQIYIHINKEESTTQRNKLMSNYEKIIKTTFEKIQTKLQNKCTFLSSNSHMYTLKNSEISKPQLIQKKQTQIYEQTSDIYENQDVDIDDLDEDGNLPNEVNNPPVNTTNTFSQEFPEYIQTQDNSRPSKTNAIRKLKRSSSQPLLIEEHLNLPKNLHATKQKFKMKQNL